MHENEIQLHFMKQSYRGDAVNVNEKVLEKSKKGFVETHQVKSEIKMWKEAHSLMVVGSWNGCWIRWGSFEMSNG